MTNVIGSPISYSSIVSIISISGRHSHYTEASLIKKLEDLGIGRPSTFATIVDTNLERGYIKKTDIEGSQIVAKEYRLEKGKGILIEEKTRVFGAEKGKLVIEPIGILTIEFLVGMFNSLFSYDYTSKLETELDTIASGSLKNWQKICESCVLEIDTKIKAVNKIGKQAYPIGEEGYELVFEKYGPVLRKGSKESYIFYSVKKEITIDLGKLQRGEYKLEDLKEEISVDVGEHNGYPIIIKTGPYGNYMEWNTKKISLRSLEKPIGEIQKEDIISFLQISSSTEEPNEHNKNILRIITPELSIRKGKYGAYIYYMTPEMSKPTFYNIQKFKESYHHCSTETIISWINKTYNTKFSIQ
jgi:DNA topoisomerase-1